MLIKIVLLFFLFERQFPLTLCGSRGLKAATLRWPVVGMIDLSRRLVMSSCAVESTSSIGVFLCSSSPK